MRSSILRSWPVFCSLPHSLCRDKINLEAANLIMAKSSKPVVIRHWREDLSFADISSHIDHITNKALTGEYSQLSHELEALQSEPTMDSLAIFPLRYLEEQYKSANECTALLTPLKNLWKTTIFRISGRWTNGCSSHARDRWPNIHTFPEAGSRCEQHI
jgi:hypothetical protein